MGFFSLFGSSLAILWDRLRHDNNVCATALWVFVGIHLLTNLVLFGVGANVSFSSEIQQRYYNAYLSGRLATDREMRGWFGRFHDDLGTWSWVVWVVLLIAAIVYTVISRGDEVGDFFGRIAERFGRRGAQDLPDSGSGASVPPRPIPASGSGREPGPWRRFFEHFGYEWVSDILRRRRP